LLHGLSLAAAKESFAEQGCRAEGAEAHAGFLQELAAGDKIIFKTWLVP
jgi:hypothetical protein